MRTIEPPAKIRWFLRPGLWLAKRMTGKDPLPARLLAHFPKGAVGAGIFELCAAGERDLDRRLLAIARIVASVVGGCAFCVDMNAHSGTEAGLDADALQAVLAVDLPRIDALGAREGAVARYAVALSRTPVAIDDALATQLDRTFAPRELVVLAVTIAQVNFWTRFNQGLGVPAAGFFDERVCPLPARDADS